MLTQEYEDQRYVNESLMRQRIQSTANEGTKLCCRCMNGLAA